MSAGTPYADVHVNNAKTKVRSKKTIIYIISVCGKEFIQSNFWLIGIQFKQISYMRSVVFTYITHEDMISLESIIMPSEGLISRFILQAEKWMSLKDMNHHANMNFSTLEQFQPSSSSACFNVFHNANEEAYFHQSAQMLSWSCRNMETVQNAYIIDS
jgi:hypothetical protein